MNYKIYQCKNCGAKNRVPSEKGAADAKCGKCHKPIDKLALMEPVTVTDSTFSEEVLGFPGAVVVDFWASWCAPCKMMSPVIDELSAKYAGKIKFAKMNVDENRITPAKYSIQGIPALLVFKKGEVVKNLVGARPKEELERELRGFIS
jgi:thioredoxin